MSSRKFKFISPGVFINEIDRSQINQLPGAVGPLIIGRFEKGPVLTPVQVNSFEDLVLTFGNPIAGGGSGDLFREGNYSAPTYGAYAAQAYLRNNSPVTVVRLLGDTNKDADGTANSLAGWKTDNTALGATTALADQGGAYGLFVAQHPALNSYTIDFNTSGSSAEVTGTFSGSIGGFVLSGTSDTGVDSAFASGQGHFGTGSGNTQTAANFAAAVNSASAADGYGGFTATSSGAVATITLSSVYSHLKVSSSVASTVVLTGAATNDTQNGAVANDTFAYATGSAFAATGTLAAIWYLDEGVVELDGNDLSTGSVATTGSGIFLRPVADGTFKAIVRNGSNTAVARTSFNFSEASGRFIRKQFNTNPTLTNDSIISDPTTYWLGETFEGAVNEKVLNTTSDKNRLFGAIIPLTSPNGTTRSGGDFKKTNSYIDSGDGIIGKTGWIIAQDTDTDYDNFNPANAEKLFKFAGRLTREDVQRKIKISISDISPSLDPNSPYGTFTVQIRDMQDTDDSPNFLEQYTNCNLNPASDNYIARQIGDKYQEWDYDAKLYREYGNYANVSKYVRIEESNKLKARALDGALLPFGFFGPPVFNSFTIDGAGDAFLASNGAIIESVTTGTLIYTNTDYTGSYEVNTGAPVSQTGTFGPDAGSGDEFTGSIRFDFPELRLRISSSEGFLQEPTDAYFGVDTTYKSNTFDKSVLDVIRAKPADINSHDADTDNTTPSYVFTLENIRNVAATSEGFTGSYLPNAVYDENARKNKTAYNVLTGASGEGANTEASYENVLNAGFNRFTTVLHGGFDAVDIKEREPFRNTFIDGASATTNYAYNSIELAIDSVRDSERVEYNLLSMPGLTETSLCSKIVRVAEQRGDALGIIDVKGGYVPDTESTATEAARIGTVSAVVNTVKNDLKLNSSYGACYYPWVQIRDTVNGINVWAPPSVAAIGALGYSESVSELWFAPAGFTRGGLSANNAAGLPVVGVRQRLTSKDRDKLYDNHINPIASFPAEGIVIFGQKTLQTTPSALDRINVRRLAIFLKREISRISSTLLFDQNVQTTWARFKGQAENLLSSVKAGLGLTDYKIVLDETTTTPDLVDRNILYAKIFVKPARAIEFIAIDFIITDSGASFDD